MSDILHRNTDPAHEANKRYAAERAIGDPVKLARAVRIVRLALARQLLTVEDLIGGDGGGA